MHCVRCGKQIPDGEIFCEACASAPLPAGEKAGSSSASPVSRTRTSARSSTNARTSTSARRPERRKGGRGGLIVTVILLLIITGASLWYTYQMYDSVRHQQATMRVQEANLAEREYVLSGQMEENERLESEIAEAQQTEASLRSQIADMQAKLKGNESSVNQSQYDLDAAMKRMESMQTALDTANAALTELNEEQDKSQESFDELQESYDAMKEKFEKQSEKMDWVDAYVVYVENDGSNYYHTFECSKFKRQSFWVYNRKLAENKGYTACPICGG